MRESEMAGTGLECWHFLRPDRRLTYGDGRRVVAGETLSVVGLVEVGRRGLHGAVRALDALEYASGPVVERVRLEEPVLVRAGVAVSASRTCLWQADASRTLHEFGCWCAERELIREREAGREPDPSSWAAVEAKRRWLRGEIGDVELAAAGAAIPVKEYHPLVTSARAGTAAWSAAIRAAVSAANMAARSALAAPTAGDGVWVELNAELERLLWLLAPPSAVEGD